LRCKDVETAGLEESGTERSEQVRSVLLSSTSDDCLSGRHQVDVERLTRATLDADEIVEDGSAGHGRRGGLVSEIDHDGSFKEKRYGLVPKVERRGIAGDFELGLLVEVEDSRREVADGQVGRKRGDLGVAVDGADEM
jgi:hypothetical protein